MMFCLNKHEIRELDIIFPEHKNFEKEIYCLTEFSNMMGEAVYLLDQKIHVCKDLSGARKWLLDEKNKFTEAEKHDYQLEWNITKDSLIEHYKEISSAKRILRNIIKRFSSYHFKKYGYHIKYGILIKIKPTAE